MMFGSHRSTVFVVYVLVIAAFVSRKVEVGGTIGSKAVDLYGICFFMTSNKFFMWV